MSNNNSNQPPDQPSGDNSNSNQPPDKPSGDSTENNNSENNTNSHSIFTILSFKFQLVTICHRFISFFFKTLF